MLQLALDCPHLPFFLQCSSVFKVAGTLTSQVWSLGSEKIFPYPSGKHPHRQTVYHHTSLTCGQQQLHSHPEAGTMLVGQLELQGGSILCASHCSEKNAQILALGKSCWTFLKHLAWETSGRSLPIVPCTTPWPLRWPWSQESKSIACLGTHKAHRLLPTWMWCSWHGKRALYSQYPCRRYWHKTSWCHKGDSQSAEQGSHQPRALMVLWYYTSTSHPGDNTWVLPAYRPDPLTKAAGDARPGAPKTQPPFPFSTCLHLLP